MHTACGGAHVSESWRRKRRLCLGCCMRLHACAQRRRRTPGASGATAGAVARQRARRVPPAVGAQQRRLRRMRACGCCARLWTHVRVDRRQRRGELQRPGTQRRERRLLVGAAAQRSVECACAAGQGCSRSRKQRTTRDAHAPRCHRAFCSCGDAERAQPQPQSREEGRRRKKSPKGGEGTRFWASPACERLLWRAPVRMTRWRRASFTTRSCMSLPCWP